MITNHMIGGRVAEQLNFRMLQKTIAEKQWLKIPLFGGLLLLLSVPFLCLVILWQDKWDYLDSLHEYLKKRNGGKRADW